MDSLYKEIKEAVLTAPLSLLALTDRKAIDIANNYLPYSTGFEIECDQGDAYRLDCFQAIPDIMHIENGYGEQRYRIPNGVKGMICLYNITEQLKINSLLNPGSGIHYHIDMTDCYGKLNPDIKKNNADWILKELDTWTAAIHNRRYGSWFRFADEHRTIEIRVGEMSFEYEVIINRMIHANKITRKLKDSLGNYPSSYSDPNLSELLKYMSTSHVPYTREIQALQDELRNNSGVIDRHDEVYLKSIISKRVVRI